MKTKEEILEYIDDIDLSLMLLEDTMKGQIGDAITKARGQLEDIRKYHASQFQQEWIPVEVKLPGDGRNYLVTDGNAMIVATYRIEIGQWHFWKNTFWKSKDVTHWMPLPPKPQPYNPTKS